MGGTGRQAKGSAGGRRRWWRGRRSVVRSTSEDVGRRRATRGEEAAPLPLAGRDRTRMRDDASHRGCQCGAPRARGWRVGGRERGGDDSSNRRETASALAGWRRGGRRARGESLECGGGIRVGEFADAPIGIDETVCLADCEKLCTLPENQPSSRGAPARPPPMPSERPAPRLNFARVSPCAPRTGRETRAIVQYPSNRRSDARAVLGTAPRPAG